MILLVILSVTTLASSNCEANSPIECESKCSAWMPSWNVSKSQANPPGMPLDPHSFARPILALGNLNNLLFHIRPRSCCRFQVYLLQFKFRDYYFKYQTRGPFSWVNKSNEVALENIHNPLTGGLLSNSRSLTHPTLWKFLWQLLTLKFPFPLDSK